MLSASVTLGGCRAAPAGSPLADTRDSAAELIQAVLEATKVKDREALRGLLVTRDEYERLLWPEMPDGRYTPFDFVWSLNATNSRKGLGQLLERYGGLDLELVSLAFTDDPEAYDHFTLHAGARVTVRRGDTGEEGILPSLDVFVEYGGTWKLVNYDEL
ncbi:MAG TPA: hypothetical protein VE173_10000 [Longimicrobiales bacterium]|nr:hypothetical protein [Longimicrobiales bacterium]